MALSASENVISSSNTATSSLSLFPTTSKLETSEQQRRFELLRLAFFSLKLRKLEQRLETKGGQRGQRGQEKLEVSSELQTEHEYRCSLLRHAIFHQMLTLIQLGAREQALHIIAVCQK
ncbi:MAG: hypothetical protein M3Z24_13130 [Chloroflexota bacterium]|nr:hypothetical protein [Chloroflexota bacterium]